MSHRLTTSKGQPALLLPAIDYRTTTTTTTSSTMATTPTSNNPPDDFDISSLLNDVFGNESFVVMNGPTSTIPTSERLQLPTSNSIPNPLQHLNHSNNSMGPPPARQHIHHPQQPPPPQQHQQTLAVSPLVVNNNNHKPTTTKRGMAVVQNPLAKNNLAQNFRQATIIKQQTTSSKRKATTASTKARTANKVVKAMPSATPASSTNGLGGGDFAAGMTEHEMEKARRERNREHAKRSRLRRKSLTQDLQASLQALKDENASLKQQLQARFGSATVESMLQTKRTAHAAAFCRSLQRMGPCDAKTVSFLKSLSSSKSTSTSTTTRMPKTVSTTSLPLISSDEASSSGGEILPPTAVRSTQHRVSIA